MPPTHAPTPQDDATPKRAAKGDSARRKVTPRDAVDAQAAVEIAPEFEPNVAPIPEAVAKAPLKPFPDLSGKGKESDPGLYEGISVEAQSLQDTPYDYLVIGSGAGGGPLAARLATYGFKVLVLEAGTDPAAPLRDVRTTSVERQRKLENERRLYHCPSLSVASTEPHLYLPAPQGAYGREPLLPPLDPTSWCFTAHHFANDRLQQTDRKYDPPTGGVPYPRGCGLGGSTGHNVLISIVPSDSDWQRIADLTNDDSWAPARMRAIFRRIERNRYGVVTGKLGRWWKLLQRKLGWETGVRGERGWLDIAFANPTLALRDWSLRSIILIAIFRAQGLTNPKHLLRLLLAVVTGGVYRPFDLNDPERFRNNPQGFTLVPMSVNNANIRRGPREHLLEVRRALREKAAQGCVHIATGVHVRRLLFVHEDGRAPRAVGVEFSHGLHLYRADLQNPQHPHNQGPGAPPLPSREGKCFAKREVLLCGGTFNSPQLLMLSGIGDEAALVQVPVAGTHELGLTYVDPVTSEILAAQPARPRFVNLPGVGRNLRDRLELSVISVLHKDYNFFRGVRFQPYPKTVDPQLEKYLAEKEGERTREGAYTSNGAAFALVWDSGTNTKPDSLPPDLFIFGVPTAFRGYSYGYSQQLLSRQFGQTEPPCYRLWSWTLLKAYSQNDLGEVTLASTDPFEPPRIDHHYFCEKQNPVTGIYDYDRNHPDLKALAEGVKHVRTINDAANSVMRNGSAAGAELEPGREDAPDDSPELRDWIAKETWGHHASGTCRMGRDRWRENPQELKDEKAVLDSKFKVHGVRGLRIVDASAFPYIPGYFVALPIIIMAEKAAETILDEISF